MVRPLQLEFQLHPVKYGAVVQDLDILQIRLILLSVEPPDIAPQAAALPVDSLTNLRTFVDGCKEALQPLLQHLDAAFFMVEGSDALPYPVPNPEPVVLQAVGELIRLRIIGVHDIPHALRPHPGGAGIELLLRRGLLLIVEDPLLQGPEPCHKAHQHAPGMGGELYREGLAGPGIPHLHAGEAQCLHIELHREQALRGAGGDGLHLAAVIVIPQDVPQQVALRALSHGRGLMGLGGVAGLADVQVGHHGVVRIRNRGGMAPGVLRIQQGIVLPCPGQAVVPHPRLLLQPVAGVGQPQGLPVVLHRIGGAPHAVAPPVVDGPSVHRRLRCLLPNQAVELLQGHHPQLRLPAEPLIKSVHRGDDGRVGGGIVGEDAADAGDIEIIRVAAVLILPDALRKLVMQGVQRRRVFIFPEIALGHIVHVPVEHDAQGVAQVVVLPVPHKQPAAPFALPEIGRLVLIERVHAVVGMDIGEQELDPVLDQRVPGPQGYPVDVRVHGGPHRQGPCR